MKVSITERQLKYIISKKVKEKELSEDEAAAPTPTGSSEGSGGKPESGASSKQSGGSGYPEVSTWSDKVGNTLKRSVGNPIDYKLKWEDEIDITRGPDNQLK